MAFEHELIVAERLAREAGLLALRMRPHLEIYNKASNQGPVSSADLAADTLIVDGLYSEFNSDTVISEESYTDSTPIPGHGRVWFVDPIDGTRDYISGGPDFSVMIGLCIDGTPRVGVVYEPVTGILWRGTSEHAEQVDPDGHIHLLDASAQQRQERDFCVVVSRNHSRLFESALIARMGPVRVIQKGSVGLKVVLVASGQADLYISGARNLKLWDTAGPCAILAGAKGVMYKFDGSPLTFTGPISHKSELYATLPQHMHSLQILFNG